MTSTGQTNIRGLLSIDNQRVEYSPSSTGNGDLFFTRIDYSGNNTTHLVFGRNFSFDGSDVDIFSLNDQAELDVHRLLNAQDGIEIPDNNVIQDSNGNRHYRHSTSGWTTIYAQSGGQVDIYDDVNGMPIATFEVGGNVGIGTTSPQHKVSADGQIHASGNVVAYSTAA